MEGRGSKQGQVWDDFGFEQDDRSGPQKVEDPS